MRVLPEGKLVVASHNKGKVREIAELLKPLNLEVVSAADLNLEEPEETGKTFTENALLKAHAAAKTSGLPSLSDDSGLCVNALGGDPGIYSARWAGADKDFYAAMRTIEEKLADASDRSAYFICVLALAWPDGRSEVFEGRVDGTLSFPPKGEKGFGYDPIFIPDGYAHTFAEMEPDAKKAISHRAKAFTKFDLFLR